MRPPPARGAVIVADGIALALFMLSASAFAVFLEHPDSPARGALESHPVARRALMGLAMGLTAVVLVQTPAGRRLGPHVNPAVTLALLRLSRVDAREAAARASAQFAGGLLGMALASWALAPWIAHSAVDFVVTRPGPAGPLAAFAAEAAISFGLFLAVEAAQSHPAWRAHAGWVAGFLVGTWILVEGPLSGMSMNPARTLASAVLAHDYGWIGIYFTAPPLGMLAAAEITHRAARPAPTLEKAWTSPSITT